jgi:hypothetical protein
MITVMILIMAGKTNLQLKVEFVPRCLFVFLKKQNKNKLRGLSLLANYTDRATAACRGVAQSARRIPYGRILLSRPEPLLFLSSSSSVVLMRLSGPRSRPTTSQKVW